MKKWQQLAVIVGITVLSGSWSGSVGCAKAAENNKLKVTIHYLLEYKNGKDTEYLRKELKTKHDVPVMENELVPGLGDIYDGKGYGYSRENNEKAQSSQVEYTVTYRGSKASGTIFYVDISHKNKEVDPNQKISLQWVTVGGVPDYQLPKGYTFANKVDSERRITKKKNDMTIYVVPKSIHRPTEQQPATTPSTSEPESSQVVTSVPQPQSKPMVIPSVTLPTQLQPSLQSHPKPMAPTPPVGPIPPVQSKPVTSKLPQSEVQETKPLRVQVRPTPVKKVPQVTHKQPGVVNWFLPTQPTKVSLKRAQTRPVTSHTTLTEDHHDQLQGLDLPTTVAQFKDRPERPGHRRVQTLKRTQRIAVDRQTSRSAINHAPHARVKLPQTGGANADWKLLRLGLVRPHFEWRYDFSPEVYGPSLILCYTGA
ncbi:hypothetical protein [Levilactobacillus suantsaii]|uniref:Uncharacterized protein n=1 Tax=Levilactobacillus suantsaii TaxID=2292255 RepID=A0A4Q0VL72_9LACO|nr:hypothetical protein [Levilactobacillus suantsaii]QMU07158.1 hypothetical protein H3M12_06520 [Levilactobacillus suantsaii]RXI80069.1 hypothetical protein DXH47_00455 [Levilactobacillus suantsaii]